jgi:hypothetical protein
MKKLVLFAGAGLLAAASAVAQPVLTDARHQPLTGTSYTYFIGTNTPPAGNAGASQTWDFSALTPDNNEVIYYMNCSVTPYCSSLTGGTIAGKTGDNYLFYNTDNSKSQVVGFYAGNVLLHFSDPEDHLRFPFTYNDNFKDSFKVDFSASGVAFKRLGEVETKADGYGTLILPTGTFNNTLRISRKELYTDYVSGATAFVYEGQSYIWYSADHREALLSLVVINANGSLLTQSYQYTNQYPLSVGNLNENRIDLSLYPNPAREALNVSFTLDNNTDMSVNLLDITGREVLPGETRSYAKGKNQLTLSTGNLPSGMYLLQLRSGQSTIHKKVQIL